MTERDPERWLADQHADPELRRLLEAGRSERPRAQALRLAPIVISTFATVAIANATGRCSTRKSDVICA